MSTERQIRESETRKACWYDASDDPEELSVDSPEEALLQGLEGILDVGDDVEQVIRMWGRSNENEKPEGVIEVHGYAREVVTNEWLKREAGVLVDRFTESFEESFGDTEGRHDCFDSAEVRKLEQRVFDVLRSAVGDDKKRVWRCDAVSIVTFTVEEVIALARGYEPDWFVIDDVKKDAKRSISEIDAFHAHLDQCDRCRNHPFDLCPVGAPLLAVAGESAAEWLRTKAGA